MKNITIGFSKPRSKWTILSWIIRKIEKVPFSHVYVKFRSDSLDRDIIYQASGTSVNFVGSPRFHESSMTVEEYTFEVSDVIYRSIIQYAIDNAGKPYGKRELIGMGLVRAAALFGKNIKNPFRDGESSYICVELAGVLLWTAGLIKDATELESIGLSGFYQLMKDLNHEIN